MTIDPTFQVRGKVVLDKPYDGTAMGDWLSRHLGAYGRNWLTLMRPDQPPVLCFADFTNAVAFALAFDLVPR